LPVDCPELNLDKIVKRRINIDELARMRSHIVIDASRSLARGYPDLSGSIFKRQA
jgi:hypothetical protein